MPSMDKYSFVRVISSLKFYSILLLNFALKKGKSQCRKHWLAVVLICTLFSVILYLRKDNRKTLISIVEEHHEVLPYWFAAASKGKISLKGNTLLHIDAHPDDAPPEYFAGYPYFRAPHNNQELGYMMQRNDAFIQAAIMAGLIKRVVFVWPSWSKIVYKQSYIYRQIGLGSAEIPGVEDEYFCECEKQRGKYKHCMIMNYTRQVLDLDPEVKIDPKLCKIQAQYDFESLDEDSAINLAGRNDWFKKDENIILDIDEDFFGVESVFETMFSGHELSYQNYVVPMSKLTASLFCPESTLQEQRINKFIISVIDLIIKNCKWIHQNQCEISSKIKDKIKKDFISFIVHDEEYLCSPNDVVPTWTNFTEYFLSLSKDELKIIKEIGFCLETGPRTLGFFDPDEDVQRFILCVGRNVPGDTMVTLYSPEQQDIDLFSNKLYNILHKLQKHPPKLVTIARSVRDGFTSRKYSKQIEQNIIDIIMKSWDNDHRGLFRVHYDKYLLGGKNGWPMKEGIL